VGNGHYSRMTTAQRFHPTDWSVLDSASGRSRGFSEPPFAYLMHNRGRCNRHTWLNEGAVQYFRCSLTTNFFLLSCSSRAKRQLTMVSGSPCSSRNAGALWYRCWRFHRDWKPHSKGRDRTAGGLQRPQAPKHLPS
jgi:hypothetical protein